MDTLIDRPALSNLVRAFYKEVRKDPLLAPIFASKITPRHWPAHEERIVDFWSSIFLKTGGFRGNPMQKHAGLTGVTPQHFTRWLTLFKQTADDVLPADQAKAVDIMANRIGQSLQMGMAFQAEKSGQTDHAFKDFGLRRAHTAPRA